MRTCEPDAYRLLGLPLRADDAQIRERYLALSRIYHPDRAGGSETATRAFQAISSAYRDLSTSAGRQAVDRAIAIREPSRFAEGAAVGRAAEVIASVLERLGRQPTALPAPTAGRDLRVVVALPFARAALGGPYEVEASWSATCGGCGGSGSAELAAEPTCHVCSGEGVVRLGLRREPHRCGFCVGKGRVFLRRCATCQGTGEEARAQRHAVQVPPRCRDGQLLRVRGSGEPGRGGGPAGDLIVDVRVLADPHLRVDGDDIVCALPVTLGQLLRRERVAVPSLEGAKALRLPSASHEGQELRVPGRGLPRPDGGRGDLRYQLAIEVPRGVSAEALAAYLAFEALLPAGAHRRADALAAACGPLPGSAAHGEGG